MAELRGIARSEAGAGGHPRQGATVIAELSNRVGRGTPGMFVSHLVGREFKLPLRALLRRMALGDRRPVVACLLILSFLFKRILVVDQPNYTVFLFVGIVAWAWFASAVVSATGSAVDRRDLLSRPGVPRAAVPLVSVLTDFLDLLAALPVLAVFIAVGVGLHWTILAFPVVLFVEFLLILAASASSCALRTCGSETCATWSSR